jgi:hypothetical protein
MYGSVRIKYILAFDSDTCIRFADRALVADVSSAHMQGIARKPLLGADD